MAVLMKYAKSLQKYLEKLTNLVTNPAGNCYRNRTLREVRVRRKHEFKLTLSSLRVNLLNSALNEKKLNRIYLFRYEKKSDTSKKWVQRDFWNELSSYACPCCYFDLKNQKCFIIFNVTNIQEAIVFTKYRLLAH